VRRRRISFAHSANLDKCRSPASNAVSPRRIGYRRRALTLASAQAEVTIVQQDAEALTITAPFAGRIETRTKANMCQRAPQIGRLVDITADGRHSGAATVADTIVHRPASDNRVYHWRRARWNGDVWHRVGCIRNPYILAEMRVANADGVPGRALLKSFQLGRPQRIFHRRPMSLDTDGTLGVKTVNAENIANFSPPRS
jgi:multidrug efflux system membrane fusion protein